MIIDPVETEAGEPDRHLPEFRSVVVGELNFRGIPIGDVNTAVDDGKRSVTGG